MFKTDQFLENTSGCCVLESSELNCTDVANVDAEEENNYYMGVRYFNASTHPSGDSTSGENKICYTTPIRKKKLNIMELLRKVAIDIIILIMMVLIAACYEYWIVYGNCKLSSIKTKLSEIPYSVNNDEPTASRRPNIVQTGSIKCPQEDVAQSAPNLDWYATIPYNLITFLNKSGIEGVDSSEEFSLSEIVKIPARSFLLGFFYCIIIARIFIKALVRLCNYLFSSYFDNENSRSNRIIAGAIFTIFFMGIYGNLADKFIGNLPYLNASSLFLLGFVIAITLWLPSILSLIIMMLSFIGYRRKSYEVYKKESTPGTDFKKTTETTQYDPMEKLSRLWDWYIIIETFFRLKYKLTAEKEEAIIQDSENFKNHIINEDILDWFFPIRRSKIKVGWYSPYILTCISNLFNFSFTECITDNKTTKEPIRFTKKYWWYLSALFNNPLNLINPFFTTNVECKDIAKACANSRGPISAIIFIIVASIFLPSIRFNTLILSLLFLLGICLLIPFLNLLWISFILIVVVYSTLIGLFGNMIALFYLHFYVIIGFFYVPFSDRDNLFKIIKSHGNILTLLFCIIVVLACSNVLHPTSMGVIGGILGLLIMYKLIVSLS
jgi:hypothetical protein